MQQLRLDLGNIPNHSLVCLGENCKGVGLELGRIVPMVYGPWAKVFDMPIML